VCEKVCITFGLPGGSVGEKSACSVGDMGHKQLGFFLFFSFLFFLSCYRAIVVVIDLVFILTLGKTVGLTQLLQLG